MSAKCQKRTSPALFDHFIGAASTAGGGYIVQTKVRRRTCSSHRREEYIIGDTRAEAADQEGSARRHDRRSKCSRHGPKIDIDVLDGTWLILRGMASDVPDDDT